MHFFQENRRHDVICLPNGYANSALIGQMKFTVPRIYKNSQMKNQSNKNNKMANNNSTDAFIHY